MHFDWDIVRAKENGSGGEEETFAQTPFCRNLISNLRISIANAEEINKMTHKEKGTAVLKENDFYNPAFRNRLITNLDVSYNLYI